MKKIREIAKDKYLELVTSWVHKLSDDDLNTLSNLVKSEIEIRKNNVVVVSEE